MTLIADPFLGRIIAGRYEIVSLINVGGMGVVYRAKQQSLDRPVAIKFIHPQLHAGEALVQRFMEEARALSRMNHPHVVSVFDCGRTTDAEGGALFLVMELLSGQDLAQVLLHERHLRPQRAASIAIQTLEALSEAHHQGIIHRDVKPENIVIEATRSGQDHVKVIDFGIAKVQEGRRITVVGTICGTPSYMAPEQLVGSAGPGADIYSTGVLLFEMLTGKLPADANAPGGDPNARLNPRLVAPALGIPEALAAVCVRAMQTDPAQRFPDAVSFATAIREAMPGLGGSSPPPPHFKPEIPMYPAPNPSLSATLPATAVMGGERRPALTPGWGIMPNNAPNSTKIGLRPNPRPSLHGAVKRGGTIPFVGRDADLAWACDLLRSAEPPPAIAFWGRPGVGKTRLAREVAGVADSEGILVVSISLSPQPCDEVGYIGLRHVVGGLCGLTAAELMNDRAIGPVDRWSLMGLRMLFSRAKAPAEPNMARRTAAAALGWAMSRAAERSPNGRVLLLIDNVDRLDGASLLAFRDRMQSEPIPGVTMLVTSQHARNVVLFPGVRERALRGLAREDAVHLLSALSEQAVLPHADDDIAPLYVMHIAAASPSETDAVPGTLDDIVAWRVQALGMGQRRVLQALAVVGVHHIENLGLLLRSQGDLDAALDSLASAGWIERRHGHVSLQHTMYGTAALAGAPPSVAAGIHKAAAHPLRDTRQLLELRAYHAIQGSADFEAFLLLEEVARIRSARGDDDGAIAALSRAVSAARIQVTLGETEAASAALGVFGRKLATALVAADRLEEAQGVLDEVLSCAEPREMTRAAVLEQIGMVAELRGRTEEAARSRQAALEIANRTDDQKLKDRLRGAIAIAGHSQPPPRRTDIRGLRPGTSPGTLPAGQHERPAVLIVEDDEAIREGIQSVLETEGHQAFAASNGREALDLLRRIPRPGLILLDLMMPVMNGWEVLEALRVHEEFATIPVVVVSAVSERSKIAASRVLRKPVEVGTLLSVVEEFCG